MKKIIFLGSKHIGYTCLEFLINNKKKLNIDIVGFHTNLNTKYKNDKNIINLADKNNYIYDQNDVYEISKALKSELSAVLERFDTASRRENSSSFKFSKKN